ncbi:MAG TPA: CAP domain-containing protein [Solirubrobacteraceae bacterium]|nr:CAP domain-containing protein [Solirubrobacteraceae bacterium]
MPVTIFRAAGTAAVLTVALVAAIALSAAPALAQGCAGAGSQKLSKGQANRAVFCLVNVERAKHGLAPLRHNGRLARIARVHAKDIVRFQFIGHDSPAHGSLLQRVKRSGYGGRNRRLAFGEILGAGRGRYSTPRFIVREWMKRQIHRKAILYPSFRAMGVGAALGMPSRNVKNKGRSFVITFGS